MNKKRQEERKNTTGRRRKRRRGRGGCTQRDGDEGESDREANPEGDPRQRIHQEEDEHLIEIYIQNKPCCYKSSLHNF